MFSSPIFRFFRPIISKHRAVFVLLGLGGVISGLTAVVLPLLAKLETDQLVEQKSLTLFGSHMSGFEVFVLVLVILLIVSLIERIIEDIVRIVSQARQDHLSNDIQLALFRMMETMEVGHTFSARFKSIGRTLESQFGSFMQTIIAFPGASISSIITMVGLIGIYTYFEPVLLIVVSIAALVTYAISGIQRKIEIKYRVAWNL